jgi:hypothetical protein
MTRLSVKLLTSRNKVARFPACWIERSGAEEITHGHVPRLERFFAEKEPP